MRVISVDAVEDDRWGRLARSPVGSLFHSPPWLGSLSAAYGFRPQASIVLDGDTPVAGLALCGISDLRGERLAASPFSDFCDPLVSSPEQWAELFAAVRARELPVVFRWRDHAPDLCGGDIRVTRVARWHGVALDASPDVLWSRLASSARRAVCKAARERVEIQPLDDERLTEFVRLHVSLRKRKYRLLAQPYSFFDAIRARFRPIDGWFPLAAVHRGRVIAATIFLRWQNQLYYKFNASSPTALPLRPNDALMWAGIRLAHELGCSRLDLGASDDDQPGLIRFKRHYAAEEREIRQCEYRPTCGPEVSTLPPPLARITELMTTPVVPDPLARLAGALLYRYFV